MPREMDADVTTLYHLGSSHNHASIDRNGLDSRGRNGIMCSMFRHDDPLHRNRHMQAYDSIGDKFNKRDLIYELSVAAIRDADSGIFASPQGIAEIPGTLYLQDVLDRAIHFTKPVPSHWNGNTFVPMISDSQEVIFDARFKGMSVIGFYGEQGASIELTNVYGGENLVNNASRNNSTSNLWCGCSDFLCPNLVCRQPVSAGHLVCPFCNRYFVFQHDSGATFVPSLKKLYEKACTRLKIKTPIRISTDFAAAVCIQSKMLPKRGILGSIREKVRDSIKWQLQWLFLAFGDKDPLAYKELGYTPWIRKVNAVSEGARNWQHEELKWPAVNLCDFNEVELLTINRVHHYILWQLKTTSGDKHEKKTLLQYDFQQSDLAGLQEICLGKDDLDALIRALYRSIFKEDVPPEGVDNKTSSKPRYKEVMNLCPRWFTTRTTVKKTKAFEQGQADLAAAAAAAPNSGSASGVGGKGATSAKAKAKAPGPKKVPVPASILKRPAAVPTAPPAKRQSGASSASDAPIQKAAAAASTTSSASGVGGTDVAKATPMTIENRRQLYQKDFDNWRLAHTSQSWSPY